MSDETIRGLNGASITYPRDIRGKTSDEQLRLLRHWIMGTVDSAEENRVSSKVILAALDDVRSEMAKNHSESNG